MRRALYLDGVLFRRNENRCSRLPRLLFALTPVSFGKLVMIAVEPRSADRDSQHRDVAAESLRISNRRDEEGRANVRRGGSIARRILPGRKRDECIYVLDAVKDLRPRIQLANDVEKGIRVVSLTGALDHDAMSAGQTCNRLAQGPQGEYAIFLQRLGPIE